MRLKQFNALLLSGVMIAGTVGMMNPATVMVDTDEQDGRYIIAVPAELNIEDVENKTCYNDLKSGMDDNHFVDNIEIDGISFERTSAPDNN